MAPEQLFRVRSDKRSDIYAFGAILYQLATGRLPFGRPGRMRKVRRRVWRDPVPPRAFPAVTSPALQEIILRCLEPIPGGRYGSATDLLFDLRHLDLVELTERARRSQQSDWRTVLGRRLRAPAITRKILSSATKPPARPPIILTVLDLGPGFDDLRQALLEAAASALANTPGARLACVDVMPTSLVGIDENVDAAGDNIHVQRLAQMRSWAQPLQLPRGKISYHLLELRNIAAAILEFARSNHVHHIVIGAPVLASSGGRIVGQITARSALRRHRRAGSGGRSADDAEVDLACRRRKVRREQNSAARAAARCAPVRSRPTSRALRAPAGPQRPPWRHGLRRSDERPRRRPPRRCPRSHRAGRRAAAARAALPG